MARIPYFDLAEAPASYTELLGERPPLNLYRMLPHAGKAAEGFLSLGGALLRDNELDSQLREIAILRVGMLSGASYEVHQHQRWRASIGLRGRKDRCARAGRRPRGARRARAARARFTDQVVHHVKVPDEMFAQCARCWRHGRLPSWC